MSSLSELISQRGKALIVLDNHKFNEYRKLASGEIKWRCVNRKCKAYLQTVGEAGGRIITTSDRQHNHEAISEHILQRHAVAATAKRKAVEDICEKPSKIIHSCINDAHPDLQVDDLKYIKKRMYNARRKTLPSLPKDISEVHTVVENLHPKTKRGEDFLLFNDQEENIIIFSCCSNLKYAAESKILYMDGTFEYCPKYFLQLFTIHGYFNGHYIPLIFCLLKDKRDVTYKKCFETVSSICSNFNLILRPSEVVLDFEQAIHNAVEDVWPETKITGCRFHLAQSWWRKIQNLGLTAEYKSKSSEIGQWLHYCYGLIYLDGSEVGDCFVFDLSETMPADERVRKFANYLVDTYVSHESLFPPHVWAEASAALNKTTNACESYHSHLNNSFYFTHPSIFLFIKTLTDIQTETYLKFNSIHLPYRFQNAKSKKKHELLVQKIGDYKSKRISRLDFIKIMSHFYGNTCN